MRAHFKGEKGQTRFYFAENDGIITSAVPKIEDFDRDENIVSLMKNGNRFSFMVQACGLYVV
jgi:hypothetical protein